MRLSAIVAMSENRVIGLNNQLPWHMPADLAHFKKITLGHPILMGSKTYLSIGRPLPGRHNIVITRNPHFNAPGCEVVHSLDDALNTLKTAEDAFIIGGATLFETLLPQVELLYITLIHATIKGDTYFPELNPDEWQTIAQEEHNSDAANPYQYSFMTLKKRSL